MARNICHQYQKSQIHLIFDVKIVFDLKFYLSILKYQRKKPNETNISVQNSKKKKKKK